MQLLEREGELELLDAVLADARAGRGSVVLVHGEAGIGKTSVVRAFARDAAATARVLSGACDDLVTPRTLGPFRDAAEPGGELDQALASGDRDRVLAAVLGELATTPGPTVLVVEDVHWADDATLDVLRYAGRRVADLPAVVVITYRDDELDRDHPAQRLLGDLRGDTVHRLGLARLTRAGVAELAGGTATSSAGLFDLSGGNPFYVSEAVAVREAGVPPTVSDAVLARVRRLSGPAQEALEQLAVVPSRVELPLARRLLGDLTVLAEAERRGVLEVRPQAVAFRHELARRAVAESVTTSERMVLNGRVLVALLEQPDPELPRVVHHAVEAGDDAVVVEHAPVAAEQARLAGAHAQEARYLELVVERGHLVPDAALAQTCLALANAAYTLNRMDEAVAAAERAAAIRERLGDEVGLGEALAVLPRAYWAQRRSKEALDAGARAIELLGRGGDSPQLFLALLSHAFVLTVTKVADEEVLALCERAVAMAPLGDGAPLAGLLTAMRGRARTAIGDDAGLADVERGLELAVAGHHHAEALQAFVLLHQELYDRGRFDEAQEAAARGADYARQWDADLFHDNLIAFGLHHRGLRGDLAGAEAGFRALMETAGLGVTRYVAPHLARTALRRGADDALALAGAWTDADFTQEYADAYELVPAGFLVLERAWLHGDVDPTTALDYLERTMRSPRARLERAELRRWQARLGVPADGPLEPAHAAFPYDHALDLADSGDLTGAHRLLAEIGAGPALRRLGGTSPAPGPAHPAGLTDRQLEILRLLATGRTNGEIAEELVLSVRTVDHHVSAVLQKLGVDNRRRAADAARELGVLGGD